MDRGCKWASKLTTWCLLLRRAVRLSTRMCLHLFRHQSVPAVQVPTICVHYTHCTGCSRISVLLRSSQDVEICPVTADKMCLGRTPFHVTAQTKYPTARVHGQATHRDAICAWGSRLWIVNQVPGWAFWGAVIAFVHCGAKLVVSRHCANEDGPKSTETSPPKTNIYSML